ncbi:uncharacterized protein LOC120068265 [Benincasa hispida]|uniref:uncharacterized protein LOC120068265 n=1 Tax=Benincasa hispida TaxID=102211 RepID=UPI0019028963|nr:uncharacterized protein LOC120068265 [Benincasa hispida]
MRVRGEINPMTVDSSQTKELVASFEKGRYKKIEMPVFNGENPDAWIFQAERYFEMHELTDEEKIRVSVISFGQDEVDWYRWANNRQKFESWEGFKERLQDRSRVYVEGTLLPQLWNLRMETVVDYRKRFEITTAPILEAAKNILETAFLNGLHPAIKAEVISRSPVGLEEYIQEAQLVEDRNLMIQWSMEEMKKGGPRTSQAQMGFYKPTKGSSQKSGTRYLEAGTVKSVTIP